MRATGARRMRRRPAAGAGASTSSAAAASIEGLYSVVFDWYDLSFLVLVLLCEVFELCFLTLIE